MINFKQINANFAGINVSRCVKSHTSCTYHRNSTIWNRNEKSIV